MIKLKISRNQFNDCYFPYLFDYSHKEIVLWGGSGSGKSHYAAQFWLVKILRQKRTLLVIRKYLSSQKQSCWKNFITLLDQWHLTQFCEIKKSEYIIVLPNGSEIIFKGLDDPEKIKSITGITDIWIEEATELSADEYDQLRLRLRAPVDNLQCVSSFNPVSKANHVYKRWFTHQTDALIIHSTYKDNKFLPEDYKQYLEGLSKTNNIYYRIYALGQFCSLGKLIYTNWEVGELPMTGDLCCGLDFGYTNDLTAFTASLLNGNTLYVFKEWTAKGKTNPEIAEAITAMGFSKSIIVADSAEPKSIQELSKDLYRIRGAKKGPDSVLHGIQQLQQLHIVVHPSCERTILELENYAWVKDKITGEYLNKPEEAGWEHCLDSIRYGIQAQANHIKVLDKSLIF